MTIIKHVITSLPSKTIKRLFPTFLQHSSLQQTFQKPIFLLFTNTVPYIKPTKSLSSAFSQTQFPTVNPPKACLLSFRKHSTLQQTYQMPVFCLFKDKVPYSKSTYSRSSKFSLTSPFSRPIKGQSSAFSHLPTENLQKGSLMPFHEDRSLQQTNLKHVFKLFRDSSLQQTCHLTSRMRDQPVSSVSLTITTCWDQPANQEKWVAIKNSVIV